jgi:hypothetical protein
MGDTCLMKGDSIGDKIKGKVKETIGMGEEAGHDIKDKAKETIGMGEEAGHDIKDKAKEELGPGAASEVENEVAKTSSDSPTKKVEGVGKALGKEEGTE